MTAVQYATKFAEFVALNEYGEKGKGMYPEDRYGVRVRNKNEAIEHGWMPGALATITYEGGVDLIELAGQFKRDKDFYLEPYSSYMVGVYKL